MAKLFTNFDFIQISLVSSKNLKKWGIYFNKKFNSNGHVFSTEILDPNTLEPSKNGLFCSNIFNINTKKNIKTCFCGKQINLLNLSYFEQKCHICNFDFFSDLDQKYQFGYIALWSSITHIWYVSGATNFLSLLLNIRLSILKKFIYFEEFFSFLKFKNQFFLPNSLTFLNYFYEPLSGCSLIKFLLKQLNLNFELFYCRLLLYLFEFNFFNFNFLYFNNTFSLLFTNINLIQRIRLLENFIATNSDPSWLILDIIPIIPPFFRPLVQKNNTNQFIISSLNKLYLNILQTNNRLFYYMNLNISSIIINAERRALQKSIDLLFEKNSQINDLNLNFSNIKSLSSVLSGKFGHFRQNLLGKRVDFSGRAVIVVGPSLKLFQCGLPINIAITLFYPFLVRQLFRFNIIASFDTPHFFLSYYSPFLWFLLNCILKNRVVLLNRAPTLHKFGIQAFQPLLVRGSAILLHPLVCSAYNADFDGDQMAIHLPLSLNAQNESKKFLLSTNNILSSTSGNPIILPSQDMIIGYYFLTLNNSINFFNVANFQYFSTYQTLLKAYQYQQITLHSYIWIKTINFFKNSSSIITQITNFKSNKSHPNYILTTLGRLLLYYSIEKTVYS